MKTEELRQMRRVAGSTEIPLLRRFRFSFVLATVVFGLVGCQTEHHSARFGNYKVIYGEMGSAEQYWEKFKAKAAGWEVVAEADDEEGGVLVLRKPK